MNTQLKRTNYINPNKTLTLMVVSRLLKEINGKLVVKSVIMVLESFWLCIKSCD